MVFLELPHQRRNRHEGTVDSSVSRIRSGRFSSTAPIFLIVSRKRHGVGLPG